MKELKKDTAEKRIHPVRILQFGEGNFLRGFFDWMIEESNRRGITDTSVAVVSPRFKENETIKGLQKQDGLYHVCLEGIENGQTKQVTSLVTCIADAFSPKADPERYRNYIESSDLRFVVSNTTEAGIAYGPETLGGAPEMALSFPGKITALLYHRFRHFEGDPSKGLTFLCCELIDENGSRLKEYVLRHARENALGEDFERWVEESCRFCDTLVDRIISGFPADTIGTINEQIGYKDNLVVKGELYHVWAIGGEGAGIVEKELPLHKAGLNVRFIPDVREFRDRKVRILNGSHTGMVPIALQLGCSTVLEAFSHEQVNRFINRMMAQEVLPMINGDREELRKFADGILERFYNPYIRHMLKSIALNSLSKWETRNFPTVADMWEREGKLAEHELFTFAALLTLYAPDSDFSPEDNEKHLRIIRQNWDADDLPRFVAAVVGSGIFNEDFEKRVPGFSAKVAEYVAAIRQYGMSTALDRLMGDK